MVTKLFLIPSGNSLCFNLHPLPLALLLCTFNKRQGHTANSHATCPTALPGAFLQNCFLLSWCPSCPVKLFHTWRRTLHLPLLNFLRFPSAHLSRMQRSFQIAALLSSVTVVPPSLVSLTNLMCRQSIPSSRSLLKVLNSICPSVHPFLKALPVSDR